jgi:muconolactone delta-isomerase
MQFLAVIARKADQFTDEQIAEFLEPEAERVRQLYTQGILRRVFSRGDVKGAVVELECASLEEAKQILGSLPFAQQKMINIEIIPLLPYRGFAPRNV